MNPKVVAAEKFALGQTNMLRIIEVHKSFVDQALVPLIEKCTLINKHQKLDPQYGGMILIIPQEPSELYIKGNIDAFEIDSYFISNGSDFSLKHLYNKVYRGIKLV